MRVQRRRGLEGAGLWSSDNSGVAARHHLRRPWWVLATLIVEFPGMAWALMLATLGLRYLRKNVDLQR